jgi:hypothetical protein
MKKSRIILILLLAVLCISSNLYAWNIPGDITFMGLEKISSDVKKTVFSIQIKNNNDIFIPVGTGFLLKQGNLIVGITCAHVVKPFLEEKKKNYAGLSTNNGFERFKCRVAKQDENYDISILVFEKETEEKIIIENLVLDSKYLESSPNFTEGRAILIPGYPLGIGATQNENNPVIRFGIVAQCSSKTNFLIDGVANPGNSGSPVFDTKETKFIGMVTSYKTDFINLFNQKQELIAKLPYNSGLSSAVSSTVIIKLLEELQKKK